LFYDSYDRRTWQQLLSTAMSRYGSRLHLYCWMTNHIHMVLQCCDVPIFKTIHWAAGAYARIFNTKYAHVGHLFQDRYGSRLIDTDAYLMQLVRYIHVNPVDAGMVDAPGEYRWSSFQAYAHACEPDWLTSAFVLALFSDDPTTARVKMTAFTNAQDVAVAAAPPADPIMFEPVETAPNLGDLSQLACRRFAVDPAALNGPSRAHAASKARGWIAWTVQRKGLASLTDVAKHLGQHPSSLSRCLARHKPEFERSLTE
jgi:putative transposase